MAVQASEIANDNLPAESTGGAVRSGQGDGIQLQELLSGGAVRQVAIAVGLAAVVAVGVAVFLWSQGPNYRTLFGDLGQRDAAQVAQALEGTDIDYRVNQTTGVIEVSQPDVYRARLNLAAEGLPRGAGTGLEMLDEESGFGASQFMEKARYHSALQTELTRTISSLDAVQGARVHLAIPDDSVFVRNRRQPSASVLVDLYRGRSLSTSQVASVVHLVSSSITDLPGESVTVVDQQGRLLSNDGRDGRNAETQAQFEHARRVERAYVARVEDILTPILGPERVRAQVTADLDFTRFEESRETFDPDTTAVRSERESEDPRPGAGAQGIPGALTNQPPGLVDEEDLEQDPEEDLEQDAEEAGIPAPVARDVVRNYEVDRSVTHSVQSLGRIQRLSVAVVVDEQQAVNDAGEPVQEPIAEEELARIEDLVRQAVGFDEARGDTVSVVSQAFIEREIEPLEEPPFWQQDWFHTLLRQLFGALVILFLIFGVLRPGVRTLAWQRSDRQARLAAGAAEGAGSTETAGHLSGGGHQSGAGAETASPHEYDDKVAAAKALVHEDPKRVAQVVRNWVDD